MKRRTDNAFVTFPEGETLRLSWPTRNQQLFTGPEDFFARTRANPDYGKPGWTRDCGKRFHRGADIAPVAPRPAGTTTTVMFSDCATGEEYASEEPAWLVDEEIFAVAAGVVEDINHQPEATTLGRYVVIRHTWPTSGKVFYSLYAHLASLDVNEGDEVEAGHIIGRMGQTSSSADARNWMAVAPHLHFEVMDAEGHHYDPASFLRTYLR